MYFSMVPGVGLKRILKDKQKNKGQDMKSKISLSNKIGAILLTIIVIPTLIISLFTVPFEFVIFESASYYSILEDDEYKEGFPQVISAIITDQLLTADKNDHPAILENKESLNTILLNYLPDDWVNETFKDVIDQVIAYLNFKTPYTSIKINVNSLKEALILNSSLISDKYLLSLDNCTVEEDSELAGKEVIDPYALTLCRPSEKNAKIVSSALSMMLEDKVNQLPESINLLGVIPGGMVLGEKTFYYYSITRWVFRLLPFATLLLLIVIAYLLRKSKKTMRKWSGIILTAIPALVLISLLVILIGVDQFVGLIFNRHFSQVIAGFGDVLLGMIQKVGTQALLWVIAISGSVLLLGLIFLLAARFTKPENKMIEESDQVMVLDNEVDTPEKEIIPETIEEIEEKEKMKKKNK